MKISLCIQARMGSERFPGKVLALLGNKPMLSHLVDRLKEVELVDHTPEPDRKIAETILSSLGDLSSFESSEIVNSLDDEDIYLTLDGQVGLELRSGDKISVSRANHTARLVMSEARDYFAVLRTKLKWGER